jgi:hypothetical protein
MIRYADNDRCLDGSFFRIAVKTRKDNKILLSELKKYIGYIEYKEYKELNGRIKMFINYFSEIRINAF